MREYDLIIIGGGAAGILCAIEGSRQGIKNILLIEKDPVLGGTLTLGDYNISKDKFIIGKEYKNQLLKKIDSLDIDIQLNTMALRIENEREVVCTSSKNGIEKIKGKNIILANGAKDTGRKSVAMVGSRCSGILTVGMAKKIFNMDNMIPGKNIFIDGNDTLYMIEKDLKNHDINVVGIIPNNDNDETFGVTNNLYKGYEIIGIEGEGRLSGVIICKDNEKITVPCDTLVFANPMLSDGLVAMRSDIKLNPSTTGPQVDDNFMTSKEKIFACGNGVYIHKTIESIEDECKKVISNLY